MVPSECSSMYEELEQFPSCSNINNLFITVNAEKDAVALTMDNDKEEQLFFFFALNFIHSC